MKDLNVEYASLMAEKKQTFAEYRKARDEAKAYLIVRKISLPSMRRSARIMKLTGNGNRNVKNTGPGICGISGVPGRAFFIFLTIMLFEFVIPNKHPPRTRSQNASFVHKGLESSQQVLIPAEMGKNARGYAGTLLVSLSEIDYF